MRQVAPNRATLLLVSDSFQKAIREERAATLRH